MWPWSGFVYVCFFPPVSVEWWGPSRPPTRASAPRGSSPLPPHGWWTSPPAHKHSHVSFVAHFVITMVAWEQQFLSFTSTKILIRAADVAAVRCCHHYCICMMRMKSTRTTVQRIKNRACGALHYTRWRIWFLISLLLIEENKYLREKTNT